MLALGIDVGTSGVRTAVIDETFQTVAAMARASHDADAAHNAQAWWSAVSRALKDQIRLLQDAGLDPHAIKVLAVDGTSGSMVLADDELEPVTPCLLYNTAGFEAEAGVIDALAPKNSITRGSSSALSRLLRLQTQDAGRRAAHLLHQSDFIASKFAGRAVGSDDNNALKTGWDPQARRWPVWMDAVGARRYLLPKVYRAGEAVANIDPLVASMFDLSPDLTIHAGTTDSIAAFLAAGANQVGDAVTSLGTTLAVKLLSDARIDDASRGIYSHRVGDFWLAGGASNTGGGVLAHFFPSEKLASLSEHINPDHPTGLVYYPLLKPGERFPINDPDLQPKLSPRPADDAVFVQAIFEGIARIEADGYAKLSELGAPAPSRLFTAGGGAKNSVWTAIRQRYLDCQFGQAQASEAAVGTAKLALGGPLRAVASV